jgi:hypothetical protein
MLAPVARVTRPDAPLFPPMSHESPPRGWLTRNVVVLSGVSFLQDATSELLYPILPIFLTGQLGAPVAVVGIIEGVAEGAASLTKLVTGRLSDRRSKRQFIGLGYGAAALGKVVIVFAGVWPVVMAHGRSRAGDARTDLWCAPCRRYDWSRSRSTFGARRVRTVEQQGRSSPAVSHRGGARGPLGSTRRGGARVAAKCRKDGDKGTAHGEPRCAPQHPRPRGHHPALPCDLQRRPTSLRLGQNR